MVCSLIAVLVAGLVLAPVPWNPCAPDLQEAAEPTVDAGLLLSRYIQGEGDARATLEQLAEEAPGDFDLGAWAVSLGGGPGSRPPENLDEALANLASLWGSPLAAAPLADLAAVEAPFDLRAWARRELGRRYPITDEELADLVASGKPADVLQAIVTRHPSGKALGKARSDDGWRDWCKGEAPRYRANAAVVVTYGLWIFGEYEPPASVPLPDGTRTMTRTDPGGKTQPFGLILSTGEVLIEPAFPACMHEYLDRAAVVEAFAKGKAPDLAKAGRKLHDDLLADLKKQHGSKKRKKAKGD